MQMKIEPKTSALMLLFVIGAILLIVVIIGLQAFFMRELRHEENIKFSENPNRELTQLQQGQLDRINSYRWVDREKQIVAIPINEAMKLLVQRKEGTR